MAAIATLFLQQADNNWIRMSGRVALAVAKRSEDQVEGLALNVESAQEGFVVPKRAKRLWLGPSSSTKCVQKSPMELRFSLPSNSKGFMGCAASFVSKEDMKAFKTLLTSLGVKVVGAPSKKRDRDSSSVSSSSSSSCSSSSSSSATASVASATTAQPSRKRSASSADIDGGSQRLKPRIEIEQNASDSECDTEPQIETTVPTGANPGLRVRSVESKAWEDAQVQNMRRGGSGSRGANSELLDISDPKTKKFVGALLVDENFNRFTDDLEVMLSKRPRLTSPIPRTSSTPTMEAAATKTDA